MSARWPPCWRDAERVEPMPRPLLAIHGRPVRGKRREAEPSRRRKRGPLPERAHRSVVG